MRQGHAGLGRALGFPVEGVGFGSLGLGLGHVSDRIFHGKPNGKKDHETETRLA